MEEEDDGRRMGSRMINHLKRNVSGMNHQGGGIFNTKVKNNVTGRVKELVLGFEMMVGSDVNLKSRSHELRFKDKKHLERVKKAAKIALVKSFCMCTQVNYRICFIASCFSFLLPQFS